MPDELNAEQPGQSASPQVEVPAPEQPQEEVRYEDTLRPDAKARWAEILRQRKEAEARAQEAEYRAARAEESARMSRVPGIPQEKADTVGEMPREKWEEWHAENPVDAMRYLTKTEARKVADEKAAEVMSDLTRTSAVQGTIDSVYKAHPELQDVMQGKRAPEETPFWQVYDEVAREMPDAKFLVKGPWIVMKEAERRMSERNQAQKERQISAEAAQAENERQARVASGYTAGSSPKPPSGPLPKLSAEQERIARKMGMTPEDYARNIKG